MRGFRFQSANVEKISGTSRDWAESQARSRERRRGPLSATTVENFFHGNDSRRVLASVLKRDSTSIPQRMRVSSLSRPVTWRRTPRSLIANRPWWRVGDVRAVDDEVNTCTRVARQSRGYSPRVTVAFAPQDRRERKERPTRTGGSVRVRIVGPSHSRRGHLDHPRVCPFFSPSLAFSLLSLVFMLRMCAFSRAYEEEEYTSVRELFAKRTEEPGRRFAGDVVPPRVRFPDGHAPRSALSEGGCRRHRRRCCCCCYCYCSRRCIHHRERWLPPVGLLRTTFLLVLCLSSSPCCTLLFINVFVDSTITVLNIYVWIRAESNCN